MQKAETNETNLVLEENLKAGVMETAEMAEEVELMEEAELKLGEGKGRYM